MNIVFPLRSLGALMLKSVVLGLFFLLAIGASTPSAAALDTARATSLKSPLDAERQSLAEAGGKIENNDLDGARRLLGAVVAASSFADLTPEQQHAALFLLASLQVQAGDAAALATATKATAFSDFAVGQDWFVRLNAASAAGDDKDALWCITTIAHRWPATVSQIDYSYLEGLVARARSDKSLNDLRLGMLEALDDSHWHSNNVFRPGDYLRFDLILGLIERGDIKHAQRVAEEVTSPNVILELRIDRRFDAITKDDESRFDFPAAQTRDIERLRNAVHAQPDQLEGVRALTIALIESDRAAEALSILDGTLARARPADGLKAPYSDISNLNWIMENRAIALFHVGRAEDAVEQFKQAAMRPENGGLNVSQQLDLAGLLDDLGRPAEALERLKPVELQNVSPYGRTVIEGVKACAYAQTGDQAGLANSVNYLKAHELDAPGSDFDALVCANELDAAAKVLIAELDDPELRTRVLVKLQDAPVPAHFTKWMIEQRQRVLTLKARPDVKTAIDKVGRIETLPAPIWDL